MLYTSLAGDQLLLAKQLATADLSYLYITEECSECTYPDGISGRSIPLCDFKFATFVLYSVGIGSACMSEVRQQSRKNGPGVP